jgi:hypothetical protein
MGDWEAAEHTAVIRTKGRSTPLATLQGLKERVVSGLGTFPIVGSYDDAAESGVECPAGRIGDAGVK